MTRQRGRLDVRTATVLAVALGVLSGTSAFVLSRYTLRRHSPVDRALTPAADGSSALSEARAKLGAYSASLSAVAEAIGRFRVAKLTSVEDLDTAIADLFGPVHQMNAAYSSLSARRLSLTLALLQMKGEDARREVCALTRMEEYQWARFGTLSVKLMSDTIVAWRNKVPYSHLKRIRDHRQTEWARLQELSCQGAEMFSVSTDSPPCPARPSLSSPTPAVSQ